MSCAVVTTLHRSLCKGFFVYTFGCTTKAESHHCTFLSKHSFIVHLQPLGPVNIVHAVEIL